MNFWDRFIRVLAFGLAQYLPCGRNAAIRTLERGFTRGLPLDELNDTSLLLLLTILPEGSPHSIAVTDRARDRGLHDPDGPMVALLRTSALPRLTELIELGRSHSSGFRELVVAALWEPDGFGVIESVSIYLGRLWLGNPASQLNRTIARGLIADATRRYAWIPVGTYDYLGWVFHFVRRETHSRDTPFPVSFPAGPRAPWFTALETVEQQLIENCMLNLVEPAVDVFYLYFYAGLAVQQIAQALRIDRSNLVRDAIVERLEECWQRLL